jgi:hypothetical protein
MTPKMIIAQPRPPRLRMKTTSNNRSKTVSPAPLNSSAASEGDFGLLGNKLTIKVVDERNLEPAIDGNEEEAYEVRDSVAPV